MKNVLLPTDFSENSWNAIKYATYFFNAMECDFYLMHVSNLNHFMPLDQSLTFDAQYLENTYTNPTKKKLRQLLKRIANLDIDRTKHKFFVLSDIGFFIESIRKTVKKQED